MRIVILDYQAGNVTSVRRALASLGHDAVITADPDAVARADKVIFPGVGAAASCMATLRSSGMDQSLRSVVVAGKPVLCVCIGLQLLFASSEEDGGTQCLGLLPGTVVRFQPTEPTLKVPHMGWNRVEFSDDPLAHDLPGEHFYFVHSYYCRPGAGVRVIARSDHGGAFCAGVRRDNLVAYQFHPEKSGRAGLKLLANFIAA
ncbi:MAG: imidazole glycerol phosphate synthase subunit HisH [Planctomycetes bacterium]|nr:imidazole glycerol phosphate synthase subunit HisH [Planctomycetota bacterium]